MRRLLAVAAAAIGLLVLPAEPAAAAFTHAEWTSPSGVTAPEPGSDDWTATVDQRATPQQVTLGGVFEHPNGVERVQLVLERSEYPEGEPPCSPAGFGQASLGSASGPTTFSFDVILPCNGVYVVRANATSRGGIGSQPEQRALRLVLTVAAPPVPVQGLRSQATTGESPEVALTWEPVGQADRDPDFAGYDVERSVDGGSYETIASLPDPDSESYVDTQPDPAGGTHTYRVVSVRRAGADDSDGVVSSRAASSQTEVDLPGEGDADTTDTTLSSDGGAAGSGRGTAGRRTTTGSPRRPVAAGPRTVTTVDSGFQETLPFEPGEEQALPAGDPAVVAEIDDGGGEDTRKQTLALLAGGSAMGIGALVLRRVLRQAASPHEILQ